MPTPPCTPGRCRRRCIPGLRGWLVRDYVKWHDWYDDPGSGMWWRLRRVRHHLGVALDARPGPIRVVSSCAGDGRDIIGVLSERDDAARASVCLLEIDPVLAARAREQAHLTSATVEVREVDAGAASSFRGAVPADVVLLVGIFGNISQADLWTTVAAAPQLCAQDAVLLWSRGRNLGDPGAVADDHDPAAVPVDLNDQVRAALERAGFVELAYETLDGSPSRPAMGVVRYQGPPVALGDEQWYRFVR